MRKLCPHVPVGFVTGFYEERADDLKDQGAFAVVEKPVDFGALIGMTDGIILKKRG
jgi:hypothetical protein